VIEVTDPGLAAELRALCTADIMIRKGGPVVKQWWETRKLRVVA